MYINFICDPHLTPNTPESRKDNYPESILTKYSLINELYPSRYNIIAGDVFHKPSLPLKYINTVARIERESQMRDGHKTYVIAGNHDVFYADLDYLKDSSLGNWIATGLVSPLKELTIDCESYKVNIIGWPFSWVNHPKLPDRFVGDFNILVGHTFWEPSSPIGKDMAVSRETVEACGYDAIVLGHDHAKYDPVVVGKTTIYRPGSLSRGTSHWTNVWREVSILRLELRQDGYIFEYVTIPSLPPEQCFTAASRAENKNDFKKDMEKFVQGMSACKVQSDDVYTVLDALEMDQTMRDYVSSLFLNYGFSR